MRVFLEKVGNRIELDKDDAALFYREFRWTRFWGLFFRSCRGCLEGVAPDLKIIIEHGGKTSSHFIYSRSVLYDPVRNRSWQFYFAAILIEWHRDSVQP